MATFLITGATGTVGSQVVVALRTQFAGHQLLLASSKPSTAQDSVVLDFLDSRTFAVLAEVDGVFLMRPPALADVERQFGPFLDALAGNPKLRSVVFLSLQGAQGMPWVPHRQLELALEARGMPWTFLRASFFFQNLSGTHGQEIRTTGELRLPAGKGRTAFIDARDIGEVAAKILAQPEGHLRCAYELTGSEALTYHGVMAGLSRATGRTLRYRAVGFVAFFLHCRRQGIAADQALVMTMLYGLCRWGQASHLSTELENLLGRPPRTLEEFARDSVESWR